MIYYLFLLFYKLCNPHMSQTQTNKNLKVFLLFRLGIYKYLPILLFIYLSTFILKIYNYNIKYFIILFNL
jgi:hypothetical protein